MKNANKSKIIREWLAIALGIVAAVSVVCTQSFTITPTAQVDKETKSEAPSDSNDDEELILTISQDAVASGVQITLSQGLHFITNIYHNADEVIKTYVDQKIDFNSYFRALFRLIISPNAP